MASFLLRATAVSHTQVFSHLLSVKVEASMQVLDACMLWERSYSHRSAWMMRKVLCQLISLKQETKVGTRIPLKTCSGKGAFPCRDGWHAQHALRLSVSHLCFIDRQISSYFLIKDLNFLLCHYEVEDAANTNVLKISDQSSARSLRT